MAMLSATINIGDTLQIGDTHATLVALSEGAMVYLSVNGERVEICMGQYARVGEAKLGLYYCDKMKARFMVDSPYLRIKETGG